MTEADDPLTALAALYEARTPAEVRDVLLAHPTLLDPLASVFIQQCLPESSPAEQEHLKVMLWALERSREDGVDAWYAEVERLQALRRHLASKAAEPRDLDAVLAASGKDLPEPPPSLAAQFAAADRDSDYAFDGRMHDKIKAGRKDPYLALLAKRTTTETDWAAAARKIEQIGRNSARKYIAELARRYPEDASLPGIGFEFMKRKLPTAIAFRADDESIAIGVDPGLGALFTTLFHAAQIAVDRQLQPLFIDLLVDLVKLYYLGQQTPGLEERMLQLDAAADPFQRSWADWSGSIAMRFLIGHEVAHHHLRHFERHEAPRLRMEPSDFETELSAFEHQPEFEADAWSARELIGGANTISESIAGRFMPAIFMTVSAMIDDLYHPLDPIARIQRSHPPAIERARRLLEIGRAGLPADLVLPDALKRLQDLPGALASIHASDQFQEAAARIRLSNASRG